MTYDSAAVQQTFDLVQSKILATGYFAMVNTSEPKSSPVDPLTAAVWIDRIAPVRSSGLASTSALLLIMCRIYTDMLQEPQDAIDPRVMQATNQVLSDFSGDFELIDPQTSAATVREIDLLGAYGPGLSAQAGYISISGVMYRVMTITLPIIVNDCWTQVA